MNQEAPYSILREELWVPVNRLKAVEGVCSQIFPPSGLYARVRFKCEICDCGSEATNDGMKY